MADPQQPARAGNGEISRLPHDVFTYHLSMNPEASRALVESTRNQFAIPAEEQTRQAEQRTAQVREETKRHYASTAVVTLVALGVLVLIGKNVWDEKPPDTGSLLFLLALVLAPRAGSAAADLFKDWIKGQTRPT